MTGKEKCNILRKLRREIAEANNISYPGVEEDFCPYEGDDCSGTCERCEMEAHYLEMQVKSMAETGKKVTLEGIGADLFPFRNEPEPLSADWDEYVTEEEYNVLEQLKDMPWNLIDTSGIPADVVVRLQGRGILTVEDLCGCKASELEREYGLRSIQIMDINRMLEKRGLPQLRGIRFYKRREIRGNMKNPRRW